MELSEKRGQTWNESKEYLDPITLQKTRKVTNTGEYNNTMGYHTGIGWSGDGENLLLVMGRNELNKEGLPTDSRKQRIKKEFFDGVALPIGITVDLSRTLSNTLFEFHALHFNS